MSEDQLARLFREGKQFNSNDLQQGQGSGFGLCFSKGIVEHHEGTLVAESTGLGHGATFTMVIPLYMVPEDYDSATAKVPQEIQRSLAVAGRSSALKILVVDDALSNRKLLARLLTNAGHICEQAADGQEALDIVMEKRMEGFYFDTVLLDYEMVGKIPAHWS